MPFPGDQDKLIEEVAAVNPNTIVVQYPSEQRTLLYGRVSWCTWVMSEVGVVRRRRSRAEAEALVSEF